VSAAKPSCKRFDAVGKGLIRAAGCASIWTRQRALEAGYEVDPTCELCGEEVDTVFHRLYDCKAPAAVHARTLCCPGWFMRHVRMEPDNPVYTRGIFVHPVHKVPQPTSETGCMFLNGARELIHEGDHSFGDDLFIDGSCTAHVVPELRRAMWSVAEVDEQGEALAIVRGPVWAPLPQTPQASEYCALVAANQLVARRARVHGDCLGVVNGANAPQAKRLSHKLLYAGAFRACLMTEGPKHIEEVIWGRAHMLDKMAEEEIQKLSEEELWKCRGNAVADVEAKAAIVCHPSFDPEAMKEIDGMLKRADIVLRNLSAVLRLWPKLPRGMNRVPKGGQIGRKKIVRPIDGHVWSEPASGWVRCRRCWSSTPEGSKRLEGGDKEVCPGKPPLLSKLGPGHSIRLYPCKADTITVCLVCGSWGSRRFVDLKEPCRGRPSKDRKEDSGKRTVLERVSSGLHPSDTTKFKTVVLDCVGTPFEY